MQIIESPYRIGLALATIKVVTSAFVYIYNETTQQLEVCEALRPSTTHSSFEGDHYQGQMSFAHNKLKLTLNFTPTQVTIELDSQYLALKATLNRHQQPLAICTPTGRRGWTFTQKEPLTAIKGKMILKADSTLNTSNQAKSIEFIDGS